MDRKERIPQKSPAFSKIVLTCRPEWNILKLTDFCGKMRGGRRKDAQFSPGAPEGTEKKRNVLPKTEQFPQKTQKETYNFEKTDDTT